MALSIHMYDAGVTFLVTIQDESGVVDLTSIQGATFYFKKPTGVVTSYTATVVDATNGLIRYVSGSSDFDKAGTWQLQVVIRFSDGNIKHSDTASFTVSSNLV